MIFNQLTGHSFHALLPERTIIQFSALNWNLALKSVKSGFHGYTAHEPYSYHLDYIVKLELG